MESVELTLFGLAILLFSTWWFNWFLHIVAIVYGKWKLHRQHPNVVVEDLPGISILKPLLGVDPHLFENLETFFTMKYPAYELLFCIKDEMDASRMIVQSLIDKYPKCDAKVFLGGKNVGINPKINNMVVGYEAAKYDLIMISDSGLKMSDEMLVDMAVCLTDRVGLVHQMPYSCARKGFASHAEKVYFGTQHATMYLNADIARINCATGMSSLMRKHPLDDAGGLKEFGMYLAEDFFIAQAFLDRWMKLRNAMVPTTSCLEPISQCMVLGATTAWAVNFLFDVSPLSFFLVHVLIWFLLDYLLMSVIENGPVPIPKFDYLVCWLMNELNYIILLVQAHCRPEIMWRGRRFRLRWGGLVEEMSTKQAV